MKEMIFSFCKNKINTFLFLGALLIVMPFFVDAKTIETFNVDIDFNSGGNYGYQVEAEIKNSFTLIDFYFENNFWESKDWTERNRISNLLYQLNNEFENRIYPQLTSTFGEIKQYNKEEGDKITVLFYPMKEGARGYIRNIDAYEKIVNPSSNERNIIYLNSNYIEEGFLEEILAHEFMHLIQLNEKEIRKGVKEDIWLNEARAEYAITFLGYDKKDNSYLEKRIKDFLIRPSTSLIEWNNTVYDYGVINMFSHYLVEQYGINILIDSLKADKVGIESINEALKKNKYTETFADIFNAWSIAVYINDCSVNNKYCYNNPKLQGVRVLANNAFMPFSRESYISMNQSIRNWTSNWQRFVGINGNFKIQIKSPEKCNFRVSYIYKDSKEKTHVESFYIEEGGEKEIIIPGLLENISPITFIFSVEGTELEKQFSSPFFVYSVTASVVIGGVIEPETPTESEISLPFEIDKPLGQMDRRELLMVIIRLLIYLLMQGKLVI